MTRFFALTFAIVLAVQVTANADPITGISVTGKLNGGSNVSASVGISNGSASGAGSLTGTNPANGYKYSYPFTINKVTTAPGKVILSGQMTVAPVPVTLTAAVPNGAVTFSYVVNGKTVTYTGTGAVTVK